MTKTLKLIFLCLGCFISLSTLAQKNSEDVIYLKDGSVLRGEIIEMNDDQIKIQILGGSILVYDRSEMDRMEKQAPIFNGKLKERYMKTKGVYYLGETGFLWQNPYEDAPGVNIQAAAGYMWSPQLATGIGIGASAYLDYFLMPIYLDLRSQLTETIYAFVDIGYGIKTNKREDYVTDRGGFMINPGIGFKFNTKSKHAWLLSFGYQYQNAKEVYYRGWDGAYVERDYHFKRLSMRFGLMF